MSSDTAEEKSSSQSQVLELKDKGNKLYASKDYAPAIAKYTEAIELDGSNALIWANRAACRLALKEHQEALADATKATELDPTYSKAWARRAAAHEALRQYSESKAMWQKALEALPSDSELTLTDKRLKSQYEANIKAVNVAIGREGRVVTPSEFSELAPGSVEVLKDSGNLPWDVARNMMEDLSKKNDANSSAWTIQCANEEWTAGMEGLKALKTTVQENGQFSLRKLGVIDMFTSAIMRDTRVFRIPEEDFLINFFDQLQLERKQWKAWPGNTDAEVVEREALERLEREGRETVRLALNITVREWIICGFLSTRIEPDPITAISHFQRALDVINWGREVWKDVPRKERGVVFTTTFRRGVWNLLLTATLDAHASMARKNASESKDDPEAKAKERELLEKVSKTAAGILKDLEEDKLDPNEFDGPLDPGFRWSFFDNVRGSAFACKGYYHVQLADANNPEADNDKVYLHMLTASKCYYKAAAGFPEDDYNHTWYLSCAFEYMVYIGAPTSLVMEVLERIRLSEAKSRNLWFRDPAMARENQMKTYERLKTIEAHSKEMIRDGKMKMDDKFDLGKVQESLKHASSV